MLFDQLSQAIDEGMLLLNLLGVGARLNHGGAPKESNSGFTLAHCLCK